MLSSIKEGRVTKNKTKKSYPPTRRVSQMQPLVERTNALSIEEFTNKYMPVTTGAQTKEDATLEVPPSLNQTEELKSAETSLEVYSAASISTPDLEACLDLIEQTSSDAYRASADGWSRPKKRKEMKLPDMKYLILRDSNEDVKAVKSPTNATRNTPKERNETALTPQNQKQNLLGFLSFMVTYEDGKEVVYCYEIHLSPRARGRGVGSVLMKRMEAIGRAVGLEKAMLTVFKSNGVACRFYERLGYGLDEYSPRPRRLRNGTVKEVDYMILSKRLQN
ncbi:hypothetical protein PENANT_c020G01348 [Penicillium antarcticum]|uniref:N-alpha-acetyltransferase 40 n=1 Tax=Penicillium antarcticum TaxID=416450 RepID=A0A1V6Q053_9EURO|nr:uncharacterized protein N7508_004341 [Penicillium antarcticum]KAJ5308962.1 hypothetical protein N7508_004341 [Penicillium antarcticum]OQD82650.1 hypothetical protein PENANT_c020G01348 [Penicillium antarcticum]